MERYKFVRVIGKGTYGIVLECIDRETKELVAIKCFRRDTSSEKYFFQTIIRDLRVQQLLEGEPHIVKLLDVFQEGEQIYLVMEYVPHNLLEILEKNPKGLEFEALRLLIYTTLLGVRSLHRRGLIHRDIKPENILVEDDGTAKLCDFGFTRPVLLANRQATSTLATFPPSIKRLANTEDDSKKGSSSMNPSLFTLDDLVYDCTANSMTAYVSTRWYRSPEMLLGVPQYDFVVDMWAMGAIMAEAADGEPLLPGNSELDQLSLIQTRVGRFPNSYQALLQKLGSSVPYECEKTDCSLFSILSECEFSDYLHTRFHSVLGKLGVHLLQCLLVIDASKRITVEEALQHPFFDGVGAQYSLLLPSSRRAPSLVSSKASCVKLSNNLMSTDTAAKEPDKDGIPPLSELTSSVPTSHHHSKKNNPMERVSISETKLFGSVKEVTQVDAGSLNQLKRRMILVHDSKFKKHEPNLKFLIPQLRAPHDDTMSKRRLGNDFERSRGKNRVKNSTQPTNSVSFSTSDRRSTSRKALKMLIEATTKMSSMWQNTKRNGVGAGATHTTLSDHNENPESILICGPSHAKDIQKVESNERIFSSNCWDDSSAPHNDTLSGKLNSRPRHGKRSGSKGSHGQPEGCTTPLLRCPSTRARHPPFRRLGTNTQSQYFTSAQRWGPTQDSSRSQKPKAHPNLRKEDPPLRDTVPAVTSGERTKPAGPPQERRDGPGGASIRRYRRHSSPVGRPTRTQSSEKNSVGRGAPGQRVGATEDSTHHNPPTRTPLLFFRMKKSSTTLDGPVVGGYLGSTNTRGVASLGRGVPSTPRLMPITSHLPPAVLSSRKGPSPASGNP
ncbi:unnamed protein product [Phytomonas sp. EM1]|nr:unnamed protein product [Phytomonas sp. EM1]|eukprot:CCW62410.1 unnamed protein product [Phytomonas sp. isolate EM1]